ncbi:MAG: hypothetical protein HY903_11725 [Deltaproteobacteria bacterium]|nr:hypothetical protein [Deltaproteobacteria bacterium]
MSPALGVAIMLNNYFHDLATALLFASGVALALMLRAAPQAGVEALRPIFRGMQRLAWISLVWILVGGVPRLVYFQEFEWANAAGRSQIPALVVKHVAMFTLVGGGGIVWWRLRRLLCRGRIAGAR